MDTIAAALAVNRPPDTLHAWRQAGYLAPVGKDPRGRTLWRLADVLRVADAHPPRGGNRGR